MAALTTSPPSSAPRERHSFDIARTNLLPAIGVPDAETLARRKLLRGRAYRVRMRTRVTNRIRGYLTAETVAAW